MSSLKGGSRSSKTSHRMERARRRRRQALIVKNRTKCQSSILDLAKHKPFKKDKG